jgi:hypothetical protein
MAENMRILGLVKEKGAFVSWGGLRLIYKGSSLFVEF